MPVIKSAKKKLRADKKRQSANKIIKALIESSIKKFEKKPTLKGIQKAFSVMDKGVKRNVMHKNKASRIKSRLSKLMKPVKTKEVKKIKK
ncbi:MAG: hypothetical protein A3H79_02785 [Candidatus Levybacteria bacterium RIFCSPLOWO2_02_FULL_36_8b]|nr:MAG: hypothetical protein A3H79_02785 [Candidatus Levybacteria bacterium RIFCSPLOWO2_02_FULL_36_8b]